MGEILKSHAKERYEMKRGRIIVFNEYKIVKKKSISEYVSKDFRFNGFYFIAWRNELMQSGKLNITKDEAEHNIKLYGHEVGKLMVPTIVQYNEFERCYYGLHKAVIINKDTTPEYVGSSKILKGHCELLKYDEAGHVISIRSIVIDNNGEVVSAESKCNKSLIGFINNLVKFNNQAVCHS